MKGNQLDKIKLLAFLSESNRIERVVGVNNAEVDTAMAFLDAPHRGTFEAYQQATAPGALLRERAGMDVWVGNHRPMPGSKALVTEYVSLLSDFRDNLVIPTSPFKWHQLYEHLHPFMDGNGRTGRLGWLLIHLKNETYMGLGFLHQWYYESLENWQKK